MARLHIPPALTARALRRQRVPLVAGAVVVVLVAAVVPLFHLASDGRISSAVLIQDPAEVAGVPWYVGAVSDLTLFVWSAATAVYVLAAVGLWRRTARLPAALACLGVVSMVFTVDDRFLLHEIVLPWLLGVPQWLTFGTYGGALLVVAVAYGRTLLAQPEASLLLLALGALGLSVALDLSGWEVTGRREVEEGAKLVGAVLWGLFPATVVVRRLRVPPHPAPARAGQPEVSGAAAEARRSPSIVAGGEGRS